MRWREANAEQANAQKRDEYTARKVSETCGWCGAGLQEDDGVLCVECTQSNRDASRRYQAKPEVKAKKRETIQNRLDAGQCYHCKSLRAPGDTTFCAPHRAKQNEYNAKAYKNRALKRAGITPITPVERAPQRTSVHESRGYRPLDELKRRPRVRLLLTLAWQDWIRTRELFALLEIDTSDAGHNAEYDAHIHALSHLVKRGLAERRGEKVGFDYRITDLGRAEVAQIRAGNLRTFTKRAA